MAEEIKHVIKEREEDITHINNLLYPKEHKEEFDRIRTERNKLHQEKKQNRKDEAKIEEIKENLKKLSEKEEELRGPDVDSRALFEKRDGYKCSIDNLRKVLRVQCKECQEIGHYARDCDKRPRQQLQRRANQRHFKQGQYCYSCGQEGHFSRDNCPASKAQCYQCGEIGHYAVMCKNEQQNE